jgi:hypothetical protein
MEISMKRAERITYALMTMKRSEEILFLESIRRCSTIASRDAAGYSTS